MANYKQVPAFCHHCNKQVVANKEEVNHMFWLIASLFSCGIFAFVWIGIMLFYNPAATCSQCGLAIANNPQMPSAPQPNQTYQANSAKCVSCGLTNFAGSSVCKRCNAPLPKQTQPSAAGFVPQNSKEATGKGLTPFAKSLIIGFACLMIFPMIIGTIVGVIGSATNPKQSETLSQPPQKATNPQVTPNPIQQNIKTKDTTQTKKKAATEEPIKNAGSSINDENGYARPYSAVCLRKLNEEIPLMQSDRLPQSVKDLAFERCIALKGDARQAAEDVADLLEKSGL